MNLCKPIGGYFELELKDNGTVYHDSAIMLNSGRNALEYILLNEKYKKIFLPYYTCDVTLQPFKRQNIEFEFYKLNECLLPELVNVDNNEALFYVNYYGLMNNKIHSLSKKYKNIIVDNSQSFYTMPIENIPTLYSPRKFFGLPDGGFAYVPNSKEYNLDYDKSEDRISHLIKRIETGPESGYVLFKENDTKLDNLPIGKMSRLTKRLLKNIDFRQVKNIRYRNFEIIHKALQELNELTPIINEENICGPMVYPFLRKGNNKLRNHLIKNKVFVATYWPNVKKWFGNINSFEYYLVDNLVPLPIDQRYSLDDMKFVINIILNS